MFGKAAQDALKTADEVVTACGGGGLRIAGMCTSTPPARELKTPDPAGRPTASNEPQL